MHLPSDFPLSAYVGCYVSRVDEVPHQVEITLTGNPEKAWINFEGPVILRFPDGTESQLENAQLIPGNGVFQALHGSKIDRVCRLSETSCKFEFSNGYALSLLGEAGRYESYHLGVASEFCDV
jgi:hypothetical protein